MLDIEYTISRSRRAKNIKLKITSDQKVILTMPWWTPQKIGLKFLQSKQDWVRKKLKEIKTNQEKNGHWNKLSRKDYLKHKEEARALVEKKLKYLNSFYDFQFNRISIKDTKSRWGSCSSQGNLNFNYKIIFLKPKEIDYILVHELCHLKEMNHSSYFWKLVSQTIPDYKEIKKGIKYLL